MGGDPMMGAPGMPAPQMPSGKLGKPEESIKEVINKANRLLKFFIEEDGEDSKDALLRVSRFLGSKYSPRLWIVDYTKHPPEIVDYDGIPLSDWEQQQESEKESGEEKPGLFG
ncbi:hypothetical protein CMI45_01255 [Candidatus Pacearchaeota archaeon]|nr:hypothetical protein [Candidatus Pacearchaeota archaeon]